jgi:glycosyltransferase A (GT-A) superfamily protein (DUF2064 family)
MHMMAADPRWAERLLIIVARHPIAGHTKTRLARGIGDDRAAALDASFLADLRTHFADRPSTDLGFEFWWSLAPPPPGAAVPKPGSVGDPFGTAPRLHQHGPDFGARLRDTVVRGFARAARVVVATSDAPLLDVATIRAAFAALDGADVVLQRSLDGGFNLLGLGRPVDLLAGVAMSASSTGDAVAARATALGLSVASLAPSFDVDTADDLALLVEALAPDGAQRAPAAPNTWRALHELDLVGRTTPHPAGARCPVPRDRRAAA